MNNWKKAITFSYDDGVTQDIRLIALLNKYGMKGTFNLNSELLGKEGHLIREGVDVNHTKVDPEKVEEDRRNLTRLAGYEVVGMAYPGGGINFTEHAARLIEERTGVKYARATVCTDDFSVQEDLYQFKPTVYHVMEMDRLFEVGKKFLESESDERRILYVWGHSYEFDIHNTWDKFEEFLQMMAGKDDIFYGTNREVLLGE